MKVQLILLFVILGIIPMIIFSNIFIRSYLSKSINNRINELKAHGTIISNLVISSSFFTNNELNDVNSELLQVADVYKGRILVVDNNLNIVKDTYGLQEGKTITSSDVIKSLSGENSQYISRENQYVKLTMPITDANTKEIKGSIIMSFSIENFYKIYDEMGQVAVSIVILISLFVVLLALTGAGYAVKPLEMVTKSINHIAEGYLDDVIAVRNFTETEAISDSFNHMVGMLQKQEDSRQEFVSNVSHELKTPITSIKVLADSLITQEEAPVEVYKEFLVDINDEVERVNKIINDLLSLVKMDKTVAKMMITKININDFLEQIMKSLRPIAAKRNIELVFESYRPVEAEVDEVKLGMAFNNLIENAIKYNYDDGWVRVSLNADHKYLYVKVSDSGVGIPEELQEDVFERFYRVDKARSRETGGTGLGLSITRNIILLHRGSIKVYSKERQGTTFTVRIPLNYLV